MLLCFKWIGVIFLVITASHVFADSNKEKIPETWIKDRVQKAETRLKSSESGELLYQTIQFHGGLEKWFMNGPLQFNFYYEPQSKGFVRDSLQTIDKWSSLARHKTKDGIEFGWDGKKAWFTKESRYNPRFWSLTPYYFLGVPFVFADEGVNLKKMANIRYEEFDLTQIKVTYNQGVGDSPDDYYILLLDARTKKTMGVRYIVSYRGFFKDGGHSPEKVMFYKDYKSFSGIQLFTKAVSYPWNKDWDRNGLIDTKDAKIAAKATVTEIKFRPDILRSYFKPPSNAQVQKSM